MHFSSDRSGRALPVILALWSPDFPHRRPFGLPTRLSVLLAPNILQKHGGEVPNTIENLMQLAGVGKKTANVVYAVAFGGDAIAVDTHVFRVANRIGLTKADNVLNTEKGLMKILDKSDWSRAHHYIIYLGRSFCKAHKPDCDNCPINLECEKKIKKR